VWFSSMWLSFDTVWVVGLLKKITILNFPLYLVKTVS
jgi:hypothetical protein